MMVPRFVAAIEFGAPMMVWGALAATIPVLIHLMLRPRTRRQVLPTLRFLLQAHQTANRTHRLKRFLLLACRIAVVLLLVGLLMRPGYRPGTAAASAGPQHPPGLPVSAVFAFDNSASMGYRFQGQTRLAWAIGHARSLLEDTTRFPAGSQIALVTGPPQKIPPTWMEPSAAPTYLNRLAPADHDVSALRLLEQSYAMLRHARHKVREIYLFTDMTRSSWSGPLPSPPPEMSGLFVLDVGQAESPNLSLSWPRAPASLVPTSRPSELTVAVTSDGIRADTHQLWIAVDGQRRGVQALAALEPGSRQDVTIQVPPLDAGPHRIAVHLDPEDAMACDDERFATVSAGAMPRVLLVGDESYSEVPGLLRAMVAPPAQPAGQHRFALDLRTPASWDSRPQIEAFIVILADLPGVTDAQWRRLEAFARSGGSVLVVPGSHVLEAGYTGTTPLPAPILGVEPLDPPMGLAAAELSHPYLRPFASGDVDSINAPRAFRRLRVGPLMQGSHVIAPFVDGQPALLERAIGSGRIVLMAFSPQREWGQFGTQAAPFLVLLQTILGELGPRAEGAGSYAAGQGVALTLTQPGVTSVYQTGGPSTLTVEAEGARVLVPTASAGAYQLCTDAACRDVLLTYSVNVREAESDLSRVEDPELMGRLPAGRTQIVHDPVVLAGGAVPMSTGFGLAVPLGLALLVLMFIESLFSNRFYGIRRTSVLPGDHPEPQAPATAPVAR